MEKWKFLKSNITIWIYTLRIENLCYLCECKKVAGKIVKNCIEIGPSKTEIYEWIQKHRSFHHAFSNLIGHIKD